MSTVNLIGVGTEKPKELVLPTHAAVALTVDMQAALQRALLRGAKEVHSIDTPCCYCGELDDQRTPNDLRAGRRQSKDGGVEYHCYEGYCLD